MLRRNEIALHSPWRLTDNSWGRSADTWAELAASSESSPRNRL